MFQCQNSYTWPYSHRLLEHSQKESSHMAYSYRSEGGCSLLENHHGGWHFDVFSVKKGWQLG